MTAFNRVIIAGNLTRDPEIRYIPSGTAVADIGLAISESYRNKSGELVESTCFVDVVTWGRQAETCAEYLSKGSPVLVEGRLQLDQWENKQGEKRSKLRVRSDRVQFLGAPRRAEGETAPTRQSSAPAAAQYEPQPLSTPSNVPPSVEDDSDNLPF